MAKQSTYDELSDEIKKLKKENDGLRHLENALRESEESYRAVVEDQTEMISRHRPDFTVTFANEALLRYVSVTKEEFVGKSFLPMLKDEDRDRVESFYKS